MPRKMQHKQASA